MISVLIADDSFLMRTLIGDILSSDPEITVVGSVTNGEQVIEAAKRLQPDVITMDLEMPKLDGLNATRQLMKEASPSPIVVMLSAFSEDKAHSMLECLHSGAFDCVQKPSGTVSLNLDTVAAELIKKVKAAAKARTSVLKQAKNVDQGQKSARTKHQKQSSESRSIIVIGASTGGPPMVEKILSLLQEPLPAVILIAQHIPEAFTSSFAERLNRVSPMPVHKATEDQIILPGTVLVARGDGDMTVVADTEGKLYVQYAGGKTKGELHPSIDTLMESVAKECGKNAIGIIMTGMGNDGSVGMKAIKEHGGTTIVQEPSTCVVDSMVQNVIDEHCADAILTLEAMADRLQNLTLS